MQPTLKPAIITALLFIFFLTACTTGAASSEASGSCENPLHPVKLGAIWTYTSSGGPSGNITYTETITNVRADGFTLSSQFADATRAQEWFCHADGLQALQLGGGNAAGISTQGITAAFVTSDVEGVSLPRDVTPQMQWQYSLNMQGTMATPDNQQAPAGGTYSVSMREAGKDAITVPAGTFEAIRFQANSTVEIMTDFEGIQLPVTYNATTLLWYAPNVGFIKSVENGDFGGTTFSITTELQSYLIP